MKYLTFFKFLINFISKKFAKLLFNSFIELNVKYSYRQSKINRDQNCD